MLASPLRRLWFNISSVPARIRFRSGRASFVECVVARTDRDLRQVRDRRGLSLGPKWLGTHELTCADPVTNGDGWRLYRDSMKPSGPRSLSALRCAHCRHQFIIQVAERGALASSPTAEFRCGWFRFPSPRFDGPATLHCPLCRVEAAPDVTHLREP